MKNLIFNLNSDLTNNTDIRKEYLCNKVIQLRNMYQPAQRSPEWYEMRNSMLTASDWGTVLGHNTYSNRDQVLLKKCGQDNFITNQAIQWGVKYEMVATMIYELRNNIKVLEFGVLRHPTIPFLGASPDGITADGVMLEIKCPLSREITGIPPSYYWCQVQGQLEVCELDRCDFMECCLKEYNDENEYLQDNNIGYEKGVVAELFDKESKTFFFEYSPINISGDVYTNWISHIYANFKNDKYEVSTFSYWYLKEVSCVPIYRDMEWFNKAKHELKDFWEQVLYYRSVGIDKLKEDIQLKKKAKTSNRATKKTKSESIFINLNITDFDSQENTIDYNQYNTAQNYMKDCNVSLFS